MHQKDNSRESEFVFIQKNGNKNINSIIHNRTQIRRPPCERLQNDLNPNPKGIGVVVESGASYSFLIP